MGTEKKPEWLKVSYNKAAVDEVSGLMAKLALHTVCREANCPNLGECYRNHTATFLIMGSLCTRNCRFCNVAHGKPQPPDPDEPAHLAGAAKALGLRHVVITSVTRDDLPDGGAAHFARTVEAVRKEIPDITTEVLIPDFKGDERSLDIVIAAKPDVIDHNVETVRRLYDTVRPGADYDRSIRVIRTVKKKAPGVFTKTGIMVGLGETDEEVFRVMDDCRAAGCDIFTIGQYLRPSQRHIEVKEYVTPEKFALYKKTAEEKGFRYVAAGPLVRSSYRAAEALCAEARRP